MNEIERHIIYNGEILPFSNPVIFHNNRSFCYGDGLFETMHAFGTEIQFADDHFKRLYNGMEALKITITDTVAQNKVIREIKRLLNRDKLFGGTRIRLTIFRDSNGLYTPNQHNPAYIVECRPLEQDHYQLNQKGLSIDIYNKMVKQIGLLSSFKTANSLLNVMAGIYAREQGMDDVLVLNEKGNIIESTHSNIFLVKDNFLLTPSIEEGCVSGVMRAQILRIANGSGFIIEDKVNFSEKAILGADEIFLTNAIEGIRWVIAFRQRRYFNKVSKMLCEKLNKETFK